MRINGWEGAAYGKKHRTTIADEARERFPDLVDRRCDLARPNRLWVADFTYCPTWTGMVMERAARHPMIRRERVDDERDVDHRAGPRRTRARHLHPCR